MGSRSSSARGFFGNASEARKRAMAALELSKDREVEYGAAFALALSGDSSQAQALADDSKGGSRRIHRSDSATCRRFAHASH